MRLLFPTAKDRERTVCGGLSKKTSSVGGRVTEEGIPALFVSEVYLVRI